MGRTNNICICSNLITTLFENSDNSDHKEVLHWSDPTRRLLPHVCQNKKSKANMEFCFASCTSLGRILCYHQPNSNTTHTYSFWGLGKLRRLFLPFLLQRAIALEHPLTEMTAECDLSVPVKVSSHWGEEKSNPTENKTQENEKTHCKKQMTEVTHADEGGQWGKTKLIKSQKDKALILALIRNCEPQLHYTSYFYLKPGPHVQCIAASHTDIPEADTSAMMLKPRHQRSPKYEINIAPHN